MTKKQLQLNVVGTILLLLCAAALLFFVRLGLGNRELYDVMKDCMPILLGASAAYLAYCFQRRQNFLTALRDLWKVAVEAKAELIDYTHNPKPDQAAFGKAHRSISTAIDLVRGVYKNVGECDADVGLYSFEPLHCMRRALEAIGFHDIAPGRQAEQRTEIIDRWYAFRRNFLKEFSLPEPRHPITSRRAVDARPRRRKPAPGPVGAEHQAIGGE